MLIIPAVDIRNGKCVQLVGGEPGTGERYGDPVDSAVRWENEGASCIHVVDLDAAMGEGENFGKIIEILANLRADVQVSGGIRKPEKAFELLGNGATRVIIGTAALENPDIVDTLVEKAGGDSVLVALDVKNDKIAIEGWKKEAEDDLYETAKKFEEMGVGGFLFTNVDVEGRMKGLDPKPIEKLVKHVNVPVIASGGVKSIQDVKKAKEAGASALVIGTALYEGKITLEEAMEVSD